MLAYAAFEWGGVVRSDQYQYLLVLGLLAMVVSFGRSRVEWAPSPGRAIRWVATLLPAYALLQVIPLPVPLLRVLSPARAEAVAALDLIGAKVNFASLSVSPDATFQSFLLVCGYVIVFLLARELTWRLGAAPRFVGRGRTSNVVIPSQARNPALSNLDPLRDFSLPAAPRNDKPGGFTPPFSGWRGKPAATFNAEAAGAGLKPAAASGAEALHYEGSCWLAIWPIVTIGVLEAGLGLWQYFSGTGEQVRYFFGGSGEHLRWGTYANHDHYAGFLEMALPFAVVYPVALLHRARARAHSLTLDTWHLKPAFSTRHLAPPPHTPHLAPALSRHLAPDTRHLAPALAVWALAGVILAGIVFSFSRMGFIAALFSLFVMGALAFGARPVSWVASARKRQAGAVGMVAALLLTGFLFLPPDKLILRFAQIASVEGLTAEGRIKLWAETIPLIKAYPVFGCGLGGYETAFSRFKVSGVLVTDDFAHNDYLQLLAELGLVGFAVGATLAFSAVRMAVRRAVSCADPGTRCFAVACAGALAAILLHSLVDFNLYIPANAMLLAWIAGMVVGNRDWGLGTGD